MSVGYPRIFGDDVSCRDADGINETEAAVLNGVVDNLDATIGERSAAAGITFISAIEQYTPLIRQVMGWSRGAAR